MGDHGGTHVDAPVHFDETPGAKTIDEMPLETFFTEALCLDLTHVPDGTEGYITDFPGLTKESATWLGQKGITAFTVESVSPGRPGRNNFEVHHGCRDMGFTHYEGVVNLDQVVGKGRFRFIVRSCRLPPRLFANFSISISRLLPCLG